MVRFDITHATTSESYLLFFFFLFLVQFLLYRIRLTLSCSCSTFLFSAISANSLHIYPLSVFTVNFSHDDTTKNHIHQAFFDTLYLLDALAVGIASFVPKLVFRVPLPCYIILSFLS